MEVIPLEDIKTHFKIYPRAFRAETAISAMSTHLSFTVAEAKECLGGILFAGLILNADKPTTSTSAAEVLDYKPKTIYSLSAKGALVLRDFDEKRTVSTENLTPEKVYGAADALPLQTHVIYVDRDADGAYIKADTTLDVVFKSAFGVQTPNLTKPDPVNLFPSDELVSTSPSTPPTPIEPLFLKDKVHRLKQYSHAFTGSALVDWVLRNTSVVARIEGIAIASAFVTRGLITCINADDTAAGSASDKFRDNIRAVYVPTFAAARLLAWDAAPGVTGAVHGFFAGSKKKSDDHRSSGAGQGKGEGSERVSVGGSEGRKSETSVSENISKSLTNIVVTSNADDALEWESCHTNLISMDGSKARSKTTSISPAAHNPTVISRFSVGQSTDVSISSLVVSPSSATGSNGAVDSSSSSTNNNDASPIPRIIASVRQKVYATKKLAAASHRDAPDLLPMDASIPRDPAVMQAFKDLAHAERLATILETPELCDQFRRYNYFMFSQENFNFWKDTDAFRRTYSTPGTLVVPGRALDAADAPAVAAGGAGGGGVSIEAAQTVAHSMAIYLKYIVDDGPYEINVGILRKKKITATVATAALLPFFELVNPDSIVMEAQIEAKNVLRAGSEGMLASRLDAINCVGITAALFDVAENHIFTLMATDSVPKFLKTRAFHDTVVGLLKAGTLKTTRYEGAGGGYATESPTDVSPRKTSQLQVKDGEGVERGQSVVDYYADDDEKSQENTSQTESFHLGKFANVAHKRSQNASSVIPEPDLPVSREENEEET